jgi:hypothetical protein
MSREKSGLGVGLALARPSSLFRGRHRWCRLGKRRQLFLVSVLLNQQKL